MHIRIRNSITNNYEYIYIYNGDYILTMYIKCKVQ